jgi:hypothetical protein
VEQLENWDYLGIFGSEDLHWFKVENWNDLSGSEYLPWLKFENWDEYFHSFKSYSPDFSSKDTIYETISLLIDKIQGSYILGFKIITIVFLFIWVRASFPRFRYDQLMSLCWKELLPLVFAYILFTICLFYTFDMMPFGATF